MQYVLLAPVVLSLGLYLIPVILLQRKKYQHAQDYFVSSVRTSPRVFQNSSIAYALQMATFGPFFAWGASSDFLPALINSFFFGAGLFLVFRFREPIFRFLQDALGGDTSITVHEFIARQHGKDARVRVTASALTVFALLGLVLGEIFGIATVLKPILHDDIDATYMFVFGMLLLMFLYTILAGNTGVMRSDQAQLGVAYFGLFAATAILLYALYRNSAVTPAVSFAALFCGGCCLAMALYRKFKFLDYSPLPESAETERSRAAQSTFVKTFRAFEIGLNWLVVICVLAVVAGAIFVVFSAGLDTTVRGIAQALSLRTSFSLLGLFALALLPLFYQVVDITNWQRIAAVEKGGSFNVEDPDFKRVFKVYAVESPLLWFFMCMFGVLALAALSFKAGPDQDVVLNFAESIMNGANWLAATLLILVLISFFAIALSTMSSIFSSSLCAIRYDILPSIKGELPPGDGPIGGETASHLQALEEREAEARRWTIGLGIAFYLCVVSGFYVFDRFLQVKFGGSTYIALLFAFYCAQLSFVPLILGPIVRRKGKPFGVVSANWALAILALGATAGISPIALYLFTGIENWLWAAVPACLFTGLFVFIVARWRMEKTTAPSTEGVQSL